MVLWNMAAFFAGRYILNHLSATLAGFGVPAPARYAIYAVIIFAAVLLGMWYYQEGILYRPEIPVGIGQTIVTADQNPAGMRTPAEAGISEYEEVWLSTSDGIHVHAWWMPSRIDRTAAPTIIFSHENAGNMGLRLTEFQLVHERTGCNILFYDYRGFGSSDKTLPINEQGLMLDARAAWEYVMAREDVDKSNVVLYGRSLGGAGRC